MQQNMESKLLQKLMPPPPPAIKRDPAFYKDTYQNSFLLTFNLKKQNDEKLKKIM